MEVSRPVDLQTLVAIVLAVLHHDNFSLIKNPYNTFIHGCFTPADFANKNGNCDACGVQLNVVWDRNLTTCWFDCFKHQAKPCILTFSNFSLISLTRM